MNALDWVSLLNVPQHASVRSTKNPRCHGADGRDAKGSWVLRVRWTHAIKVSSSLVLSAPGGTAGGPHQVQPYSLASWSLELDSESL